MYINELWNILKFYINKLCKLKILFQQIKQFFEKVQKT